MSNINYKLYTIRVLLGVFSGWIYVATKDLLTPTPSVYYYLLLSLVIMILSVLLGGFISRSLGFTFWRYVISQIAVYYITTVALS
ncbi:MAG: hypothetical protein ABWJ42_02785 [Sulfolobales archaeon]